jgi:mannose-6-phosphate isomerase-like protein (cupin superfamily)
MTDTTFTLSDTYVWLDGGDGAHRLEVGDDFWEAIDRRAGLDDGRLVMVMRYEADWPSWEMHPAGDELVYLLEGGVDVVVDDGNEERVVELRGRSACLVPAGAWHRAIVHEPGDALHITRGSGTRHRPA